MDTAVDGLVDTADGEIQRAYGFLVTATRDSQRQWVVTIAIGWRGIGSMQQFYLTPKLFRMNGWRLDS